MLDVLALNDCCCKKGDPLAFGEVLTNITKRYISTGEAKPMRVLMVVSMG